jgi:ABC-type cobalamin/Fe3+-siderophores transport system ATPase subunit
VSDAWLSTRLCAFKRTWADRCSLSGGELQRVAICLVLGVPADVLLIDEPSAYLDSEQRILASKVIKKFVMGSKRTAFIVEHDFVSAAVRSCPRKSPILTDGRSWPRTLPTESLSSTASPRSSPTPARECAIRFRCVALLTRVDPRAS